MWILIFAVISYFTHALVFKKQPQKPKPIIGINTNP